ncbi:hypothetical protein HPP92_020953 [Vanilla planifolia]|uniref:Uncharacterized protein n=1 Tax=Vanilla planifolia TaxID=51239 RepID=A0A835Q707_VANPL|nr:hypothetical protein HPP92_020953 [Vanilla planifolia]
MVLINLPLCWTNCTNLTIQSHYPVKIPKAGSITSIHHLLPKSTFLDDTVQHVDPSVEYHCNSCSADCSCKRYHCQKQADFDQCFDCYNNDKLGSGMRPANFILMKSVKETGVNGGSWTDQETLLLLEALELFG